MFEPTNFLDLGAKFAFVAFFTTAVTTLIFGLVNRRHERRKTLKDQLERIVTEHAATLPVIAATDPSRLVYDEALRLQALSLIVDLRRACLNCGHRDADAVMRSDKYHEVEAALRACGVLIQVVRRTELVVAPAPVWNGSRAAFAGCVLRAFRIRLGRVS